VFQADIRDGVATISVRGEIDISNIARLQQVFEEVLARDPVAVVLSLEHVTYLDSTTFSNLARWSGRTHLIVVRPNDDGARKLFKIVGLSRVVPTFTSLEAAYAAAQKLRAPDEDGE
jgi:anti-anti-sigma factor